MGKIRTRVLGLEEIEKKQKEEQKMKSEAKKATKVKSVKKEDLEKTEVKSAKVKKMKSASVPQSGTTARQRGKKYQEALKKLDKKKTYTLTEAIKLLKSVKFAGFDESVELHFNVEETGLKGEIELPHSTGKITRVKIVDDKVLNDLEKGIIDFDVLITHPSFMAKLAKYARVLGPKGLMPNPKAGTISTNPEEVVKKFAKGALRWKTEAKFPLIHQMIGKVSFDDGALVENATAFIKSVGANKIKKAHIKFTMGPSLRLNLEKLS